MITTCYINCCMGKSKDWDQLEFLTENDINELNSIGYSGKTTDGKRKSRLDYLTEKYPQYKFACNQTKIDDGDFCETFMFVVIH